MIACPMAERPRPTRSPKAGSDSEHQRGCQRDERQGGCRPGSRRGGSACNQRSERRVDRVHEAEPAPHEVPGQKVAQGTGGKGDKEFEHIEFREGGSGVPLQYGTRG